MTEKHLHIVTLDVPWPVDHGGLTDLFFKLKTLHSLGIYIHLHCFTKGRAPQDELNRYCASVNYYPRKKGIRGFSFRVPFIVNSRKNKVLMENLQKDDFPVLLEGIHCTYGLLSGALNNRKILVRLHNTEFEYYAQLAKGETGFLKKLYLLFESRLLKRYERLVSDKAVFLTVSKNDRERYQDLFRCSQIHYLPVFLPYTLAIGKAGKGFYCLYHGNLSVNENERAAAWLLQYVFNEPGIPLVITGRQPSPKLERMTHDHKHTCLVANPTDKEMQDLISRAQIHVIPSFNNTGVKMKLLNALFTGRHCVVNKAAIAGSGLAGYCHIAGGEQEFKKMIRELYHQEFTEQESEQRQGLLMTEYNNETNAKKLIALKQQI